VVFRRFYAVFCRENGKATVFIGNPTSGLITSLKKCLVSIPQEEVENENLIKVKQNKKTGLLKIEGKSVQAFYNYLANDPRDNKIIAPSVFLNAQFRLLNVTSNSETLNPFENLAKQYRLALSGPITRESIMKICQVLEKTQNSFSIDLVHETGSLQLPGAIPSKLSKKEGQIYELTN
jgi:hypothetical protein